MSLHLCSGDFELFDLTNNDTIHFITTILQISSTYGIVHKYIALVICMFGSVANAMHIFVLTRPIMRKSSVNQLLSIIAVCDICTMLSYTVYIIRFDVMIDHNNPPPGYQLKWVIFAIAHVVVSIALHTITLYLCVVTAYMRYFSIKKFECRLNQTNLSCFIFIITMICVAVLCIPTLLVHEIRRVENPNREILYGVQISELSLGSTCFLFKLNLWLTGIFFKVIPCVLLIVFTIALLMELQNNRRKHRVLVSGNSLIAKKRESRRDRTTLMLVILLAVFLCTELPQGERKPKLKKYTGNARNHFL
uniref:G-protein coupled receptors family 1 profile domain-containing protein n=1 Tax=Acrobeloides nanus TaxID=290746 RepID=A0A914EBQ1_9BILA